MRKFLIVSLLCLTAISARAQLLGDEIEAWHLGKGSMLVATQDIIIPARVKRIHLCEGKVSDVECSPNVSDCVFELRTESDYTRAIRKGEKFIIDLGAAYYPAGGYSVLFFGNSLMESLQGRHYLSKATSGYPSGPLITMSPATIGDLKTCFGKNLSIFQAPPSYSEVENICQ
jgi:hypothetical protein